MDNINSRTCLVIDDDLDSVEIASKMVRGLGFKVNRAYSGREALKICNGSFPDVILLDLHMPEMNGMQILRGIRDLENSRDSYDRACIIVCSAEDAHYRTEKTAEAGADGYIMKPYYKDILHKKFEEIGLI